MDLYVLSLVQLDNSITKLLMAVHVHQDKTGMEIYVYSVMEDKLGMLIKTSVCVQLEAYGMDIHVSTHAVEEEFWIQLVDNVSVQLETGMEDHVLYVQIHKYGVVQDWPVSVRLEIGMASLVSPVLPIKSGIQPL